MGGFEIGVVLPLNQLGPERTTVRWAAIRAMALRAEALASIDAAHDASAELFERKIFITAKVRDLTPEGEAKLTDFTRPTYLAMLNELANELGEDGLEKLPPDDRPNGKLPQRSTATAPGVAA